MITISFLLLLLTLSSAAVVSTPTQIALNNAEQQNVPITRTIDSIFLRLPSEQDL